jgi:hypothetical protein
VHWESTFLGRPNIDKTIHVARSVSLEFVPLFTYKQPAIVLLSNTMAQSKEWQKMLRGELYWAWDEDLQENRTRCKQACEAFNAAGSASRRRKVELWRK